MSNVSLPSTAARSETHEPATSATRAPREDAAGPASSPVTSRATEPTAPALFDRAPFRWTQRDRHTLPVRTTGSVPAWLRGQLLRTAPAVFSEGAFQAQHWFDGHGLIYGFSLGEQVTFQQRLLDTQVLRDARGGRTDTASFGTSMQRGFFARLLQPIPKFTDNANVNIVPWQGEWLALTETPHQHVVASKDLASRGLCVYDDKLPGNNTAHPQLDFERNAMISLSMTFGAKNEIWITRQRANSRTRELEGKLSLKRMPYIHAFGLSPRHAVIIDHPLSVNALSMIFSNRGFIDHFKWQPERGTRLYALDRESGKWSEYETEPLFCFHVVNQFEDGQDVVLDFLAYDDASSVAKLSAAALQGHAPSPLTARLVRARMRPGKKHVALEQLSEQRFEFPNIPYRAQNGKRYDTTWGATFVPGKAGSWSTEVVRIDLASDRVARFSESGVTYGEPVFVPRPGAARPEEGVLLTVGSDSERERSLLAVLDATSLEPLARCEVDLSIPLGFHGNFRPA